MPSSVEEDPVQRILSAYRIVTQHPTLERLFLDIEIRSEYKPLFVPVPGNEVEEDFESFHKQVWVELQHVAGRIDYHTKHIEDYDIPLRYGDLVLDQLFVIWKTA
jgi:hypothetical protein